MGRRQKDNARIAKDIRVGATDSVIMERYALSKEDLYSLYDDLVKEGRLSMSDLLGDLPPAPEPGLMLVEECPVCGTHNLVDMEVCASCRSTLPKPKKTTPRSKPPVTAAPTPEDEVTASDSGYDASTAGQAPYFDEDATVDLDTVLDDFAGIRLERPSHTEDSAWTDTTCGHDILDAIESMPGPSEETGLPHGVSIDEMTDTVTARTELSVEELLSLAAETDAPGEIDVETPDGVGAAQIPDLDLDRTIAMVHDENLLRKKKAAPRPEERDAQETETTVDGLITLSSEIEIPESREPSETLTAEDSPPSFRSYDVESPEDAEVGLALGTGDTTVTAEARPAHDVDLDFTALAFQRDVPVIGSDEASTDKPLRHYEPTVRLDLTSIPLFDEVDDETASEESSPDDDVDLDFTLVSERKSLPPSGSIVDSVEKPAPLFEPTVRIEPEFTFNLDDIDDEQPEADEEQVELSFEGSVNEPEPVPAPAPTPKALELPTVRDTRLMQPPRDHADTEELLKAPSDEPSAPLPAKRSGRSKLIAAASVFFIIIGLGGLGVYTGLLPLPEDLPSGIPFIGNRDQTEPIVDPARRKPPAGKLESPQVGNGTKRATQPPTVKDASRSGEKTAALPPESSVGVTTERLPRRVEVDHPTVAVGKRSRPGAVARSVLAADLARASESNDTERIRLLLDRGADVNGRDTGGATLLILAAARGNESLVELLLKRGANPNAKDRNGDTALIHAAGKGRVAVVKTLLDFGADPKVVNDEGRTALGRVYACGPALFVPVDACREIVRLIKDREEMPALATGGITKAPK